MLSLHTACKLDSTRSLTHRNALLNYKTHLVMGLSFVVPSLLLAFAPSHFLPQCWDNNDNVPNTTQYSTVLIVVKWSTRVQRQHVSPHFWWLCDVFAGPFRVLCRCSQQRAAPHPARQRSLVECARARILLPKWKMRTKKKQWRGRRSFTS